MSYRHYRFDIQLTIEAPFLTQASGTLRFGIDNAIYRDEDGNPAIPATLVRGNLRHAWGEFGEHGPGSAKVSSWLGDPSAAGSNDEPNRGSLSFSPYWRTQASARRGELRYRIAIDPERGAVDTGALQVMESPFASGEEVSFKGQASAWLEDRKQAEDLGRWLRLGLWHTPALGAFKGVGFGRMVAVKVDCHESRHDTTPAIIETTTADTQRLCLRLRPLAPFCFPRHRLGNNEAYNRPGKQDPASGAVKDGISNAFVSEDFIPGNAIKGAIATSLRSRGGAHDYDQHPDNPAYPLLSRHLDAITITHARPVTAGSARPLTPPLSLVAYRTLAADGGTEPRLYDVVRHISQKTPAALINGEAPLFSTDWKGPHRKLAAQAFGLADAPQRSLQVRTAIDTVSDAAREHALFSYDCVVPGQHRWLANLTLPNGLSDHEYSEIVAELRCLLSHPLSPLGKTGVSAHTELAPPTPRDEPLIRDGEVVITLQSMARLLNLKELNSAPTNGGAELFAAYATAWRALSGGSLELINFFASQTLIGGAYWWHRFRQRQAPYNPELYTEAGSAFHFCVTTNNINQAETELRAWLDYGLPQLDGAPGGQHWRQNPYIRSNGYGEIAVNHPIHWQPLPSEDRWTELAEQTGEPS